MPRASDAGNFSQNSWDENGMFDLTLFWEYRSILWQGMLVNILVFFLASSVGMAIGLVACVGRLSALAGLRAASAGYIEVTRSIPEFVLLIWVHSVMPVVISGIVGARIRFNPILSATLALGLVASGYFAETFRAGIQAVPTGHVEAARALGMTTPGILRKIVLPQAIRIMLPELMSQNIGLLKTTTLVSVIAVPDIMYQVGIIGQQEMKPLPLYTGTAFAFFLVILALSTLVDRSGNHPQRG
jgi:polar amino acid transport system permease protein